MPQARVPWLYQQAIEEDQAMTARIAKGELTRAERRQRLENLAENIRLTELLNPPHTREQSARPGVTRPGQAGAPQADVSLFGARLARPLTAIRHRRRSGAVPESHDRRITKRSPRIYGLHPVCKVRMRMAV